MSVEEEEDEVRPLREPTADVGEVVAGRFGGCCVVLVGFGCILVVRLSEVVAARRMNDR